nr:SH3 domain-containing protein [uncultured Devosia sp.]
MNVKHITALSSATAVILLSTASAFAQPGVATGAVNVRTGPGTGYAKVGTLSAGELVDVKQCQGSWCFVDRNGGTDGWASANYLQPAAAQPTPSKPDVPFNFGVTVGPGGPSFSFGIGDAPLPAPVPPPAPATPKVCFFKSSNFAGASFCVSPGDSNAFLAGSWNDSISSISVEGGAQVTVCKNAGYAGSCATIVTSKPTLSSYNNAISSFQAL